APERHDVARDLQPVHGDEGGDDGNGNREDRNQRGADVPEEHDDDEADDDRLRNEVALQSMDRGLDETRPVVARANLYPWRQRAGDFSDLRLDAPDHLQRVHPVAHHDDAADGLSLALP